MEALQAEVSESKAQLGWLQERLDEIESQKREAITAIADAERVMHIQKHSTRVEVFRLKGTTLPLSSKGYRLINH